MLGIRLFIYMCMVSFSSFVGEDAAAKLEPFATLTPADSLVNRDLEKVHSSSYLLTVMVFRMDILILY